MSDHIEIDDKKYFEESYLILANNNTKRLKEKLDDYHTLRHISEYHDDDGCVLWYHLPIQEPPCVGHGPGSGMTNADGTPTACQKGLDSGWLTHWTRLPDSDKLHTSDGTEI